MNLHLAVVHLHMYTMPKKMKKSILYVLYQCLNTLLFIYICNYMTFDVSTVRTNTDISPNITKEEMLVKRVTKCVYTHRKLERV